MSAQASGSTLVDDYNQAWALHDRFEYANARNAARALIQKDPTYYRAYHLLAIASAPDAAATLEAERLLAAAPAPFNEYGLGELHRTRGPGKSAQEHFARCAALSPAFGPCFTGLYLAVVNGPHAIRLPRLPAAVSPALAGVAAAAVLIRENRFREAVELLSRYSQTPAGTGPGIDFPLRLALFGAYSASGKDGVAAVREAAVLAKLAASSGVWEEQAFAARYYDSALIRTGRYEEAYIQIQALTDLARGQRLSGTLYVMNDFLAQLYELTGRLQDAIVLRDGSLELARRTPALANGVSNLAGYAGQLHLRNGNIQEAHQRFRLSYETAASPAQKAFALRNLARVAAERGDNFLALQQESESIALFRREGAFWQAGASMGNMAEHYASLGDYSAARKAARAALRSARNYQDTGEIQDNLMQLGAIETQFGHPDLALSALRQSLEVSKLTNLRQLEAAALTSLAAASRMTGAGVPALEYARQAVALANGLGSHSLRAQALVELGRCQLALNQAEAAAPSFTAALDIAEGDGFDPIIVEARRGLAMLARSRHDYHGARKHLEAAAATTESLRYRVADPELKSRFAGENWRVYDELIQVLCTLERIQPSHGYGLQALGVAERGRSRAFLDMLQESRTDLSTQLGPSDRKRQAELIAALSKAYAEQRKNPSAPHQQEVAAAEEKLGEWSRALRFANPRYAALKYAPPLNPRDVERIARERNTTVLEFALGDPASHLWVVTPSGARMLQLPARAALESAVRNFRAAITQPPRGRRYPAQFRAASARLYSLLFARVPEAALAGSLLIVPDGLLYYVPFEALVQNGTAGDPVYLNDAATVTYAQSVSVFAQAGEAPPARKPAAPKKELLAFGAPLSAPGVPGQAATQVRGSYSRSGFTLAPLPGARQELDFIRGVFPPETTRLITGADATERAFKSEPLTSYRRIHLAAHAILDEVVPQRSGIVLAPDESSGDDGILRMNEIMNLRLDAQLVVLSACQTGLGKVVKGEGVIGLTRALMYAGARQVAVSLWRVNDVSTADLMRVFYSEMRAGRPASEALRQARRVLAREYGPAYRDPFYWAPFVLVGAP